MGKDTKTKILESALEIFARDGFAGTNIKDISQSVGIVKSAFYRHFDSKEEIWNAVFDMMSSYYDEHFGSKNNLPVIPKNTKELYEMTMQMVNFTIHDKKIVLTRKILLTEQFRDEKIKKLAKKYFIDDTREIFAKVFTLMMENGILKKTDVDFLSFSYTAPITELIHLCDREPERVKETISEIETFVKQFIDVYRVAQ